ncbi:WXG100 family type VII secretion target [Streptomyces boninensis]|uniref:WXG100 family type VII secretion target n=1 Tax=Streptomyces boninensis TaxID=2039455 RepID=UPI003B20EA42
MPQPGFNLMGYTGDNDTSVHYTSLTEASEKIRLEGNGLLQDLQDIKNAVNKVAAGWEGEAHTAYQAVSVKWDQGVTAIKDALIRIANEVENANGNYKTTDKKAAGLFGA